MIIPVYRTSGRLLIFAFGSPSSGIPYEWAATDNLPASMSFPPSAMQLLMGFVARYSRCGNRVT